MAKANYLEVQPSDGCAECGGNWRGGMICDTCNGNFRYEDNGLSIHKGGKYLLNNLYALNDGTHAVLDFICEEGFIVSRLDSNEKGFLVNTIELPDLSMGTITDAPLELEDGEWYVCESSKVGGLCAKYSAASDGRCATWYNGDDVSRVDDCTIKPLYKMVKAE